MPGRFVHDVGRGRVFDMMHLAHVARDHEHLVGLEFHERRRRNEAVNRDRAPADLAENLIHLADPRNALEGDAGIEQALEINLVGVLLQEKNVLPHDEAPDRVIDRRVIVVALIDRELEQMFRKRGDSRVVHRDSVFSFHRTPPKPSRTSCAPNDSRHFMNFMTEPADGQAGFEAHDDRRRRNALDRASDVTKRVPPRRIASIAEIGDAG